MTRDEMCERMTTAELVDRIAHDQLVVFEREMAEKAAGMNRG